MEFVHNGRKRLGVRLSRFAYMISRHADTVKRWEREKVIPPALRAKNQRVYLFEEVDLYNRILKEEKVREKVSLDKTAFKERAWKEIIELRKKV